MTSYSCDRCNKKILDSKDIKVLWVQSHSHDKIGPCMHVGLPTTHLHCDLCEDCYRTLIERIKQVAYIPPKKELENVG